MSKFPLVQFTAQANQEDLQILAVLIQEKKVRPFLERTFSHEEIPAAIGYIESMRTKGKAAMVWETTLSNKVV